MELSSRQDSEGVYEPGGTAEEMPMDKEKEFKNSLSKRINKLFRVMKMYTTPYSLRANGIIEGPNTLKDQLYHNVNGKRDHDWDTVLPTVQWKCNTIVNQATGYSLFFRDVWEKSSRQKDLSYLSAKAGTEIEMNIEST